MSRSRLNCRVMRVVPVVLCEVISLTSAMIPRCRSSGVATLEAMVSGLAPGSVALTEITGKSTDGRGETGNAKNPPMPASATPAVSSTVATGRRMKGSEIFTTASLPPDGS